MNSATALAATFGLRLEYKLQEKLSTRVPALDALIQGVPRGAISEIAGPESPGGPFPPGRLDRDPGDLCLCGYQRCFRPLLGCGRRRCIRATVVGSMRASGNTRL